MINDVLRELMRQLFTYLALAAGWLLIAGQGAALQAQETIIEADDQGSGVGVFIAPEVAGQTLVVSDAEGNVLDTIEDVKGETVYQYLLAPGNYEISLPDDWPMNVEVRPGELELLSIGTPFGIDDAVATETRGIDPAGYELIFSLDPKRDTDDPGPMDRR